MEKTKGIKIQIQEFLSNDTRGSIYAFLVSFSILTTLTILVCELMFMHKLFGANYSYWTIYHVGVALELGFVWLAAFDSLRENPKERLFGSRILNLPIFTIIVTIIIALYWNTPEQLAIVYGAICGGFAGYLAGGLVYGNFFVKIKDSIFRILFGGWISVSIGSIFGALFAGLVDPFGGRVFGGIFMGFWGGAIVSGPIAVVLLVFLEKNIGFRNFFTKILVYDEYRKAKLNTEDKLVEAVNKDPKIITKYLTNHELLNVSEDSDKTEESEIETFWKKVLRIILFIIFLINPWEIETEAIRVNAYRDIYALYFSEKYLKSLTQSTKGIAMEKYQTESDSGSKLRETIIKSLECLPTERSKNMILYALSDPSCEVTITAIKTLGNLKMKEAVPHLQVIRFGEFSGCWESKTDKTIAKKLMKNADNALAKISEHPVTDLEELAGKIIYTDNDFYESITDLIPSELILTQDDIIQLYILLIEGNKTSQKMGTMSKDQILDIVSYLAIKLPPEELKNLVTRLHKEKMKNFAKRIEKYEEVFL
ncbi:MAG: HEAT repeat domain-containing protein [Candidatus Heimdallarchaeota archaeon]